MLSTACSTKTHAALMAELDEAYARNDVVTGQRILDALYACFDSPAAISNTLDGATP